MRLSIVVGVCLLVLNMFAADLISDRKLVDLEGKWKFEIGDNLKWADPDFDDRDWEEIEVPSTWEDEGFPGYDGYAWYRTSFEINTSLNNKLLFLHLGYVDDADEVYLNGQLIGHGGTFPPEFMTMRTLIRQYYIPSEIIKANGVNHLAVRVYDDYNTGGIVRGDLGIFASPTPYIPDVKLSGTWKFKQGDSLIWKDVEFDDRDWSEVFVPAFWAMFGLKNYDGFGWYRKTLIIPERLSGDQLILILGKIDDYDVTYINGHQIGKTGDIENPRYGSNLGDSYQEYRAYFIPRNYIRFGQKNVIAVRVFDGWLHGGIYGEIPVAIVTRDKYLEWRKSFKTNNLKTFFEFIFGD